MARFDGKRILVTGGTSGIGLATAKRIVAEGGTVAATGRSQKHLDEAAAALPSGSLVLKNDAAEPEAAHDLASTVEQQMGGIDGLFLNAGFGVFKPLGEIDADHVNGMFDVNVRGVTLHLNALKPHLKEGASVLVTGSVSPYLGQAGGSIYAATKGAIRGLVTAWAAELASSGVRVNSISPGPIETNFFEGMGLTEAQIEGFAEQIKGMVALRRFGSSEEVAAVATFLLSDDASYVTGSEYMVDGGMTFR